MNEELIDDFAFEAGCHRHKYWDPNHPDLEGFIISRAALDKFAELIVRECVEQCNVNFVGTVGSHPSAHNRGVKKCIDNIKEHFGVE